VPLLHKIHPILQRFASFEIMPELEEIKQQIEELRSQLKERDNQISELRNLIKNHNHKGLETIALETIIKNAQYVDSKQFKAVGVDGLSGTFTSGDGTPKTITVSKGLIVGSSPALN